MKKMMLLILALAGFSYAGTTIGVFDGTNAMAVTNISFRLDCFYGRIHGLLTNTYSSTVTVTGTNAFIHSKTGFTPFGAGNLGQSSIVHFELTCVEDGGADNALFIHDIDFHFESDKLGSDNETPNGM